MGAELVPGLGASIECTRAGSISAKSLLDIKMDATTTLDLNSKMAMSLKTLVQMEVEAKLKIAMTTLMLDLKGCTTIDASNHTGTPGPGPFCSIPVCPLTGIIHTSGISVGA
jgi:hypothetical protein